MFRLRREQSCTAPEGLQRCDLLLLRRVHQTFCYTSNLSPTVARFSKLLVAGYGIRRTDRNFELASVSRALIEKFSKRTAQIEELARREYTVLTAKARALVKESGMEFADAFGQVKAELGAKSRKAKREAKVSADEQLRNWRAQMTAEERASLRTERVKGTRAQNLLEPAFSQSTGGQPPF